MIRPEYDTISIHAPREGSDQFDHSQTFLLPISIHAPREGSDVPAVCVGRGDMISIHAPREGSDREPDDGTALGKISIHAPREGSDGNIPKPVGQALISIHAPREGSDDDKNHRAHQSRNFNPRSPRGERLISAGTTVGLIDFNPRSPRGERPSLPPGDREAARFQSTLPARGATQARV